MEFREEELTLDFVEECHERFVRHLGETGVLNSEVEIDYIRFIIAFQRGDMVGFTAREDGDLVGYISFWLINDPKHSLIRAQQDSIYLDKDKRAGFNGLNLIKYAEDVLKTKYNVDAITLISTIKKDISPLFKRLGYAESETHYLKEI